jgi:hypothetical protein
MNNPKTPCRVRCSALLDGNIVSALKCLSKPAFVEYVRDIKKAKLLGELCDLVGARWGAGISNTRQLGNLCEVIHGKQKRDEYLAAFFAV